jgi:hypothetical protein
MHTYRGYTIQEEFRYTNGTSDFIWYREGDDSAHMAPSTTLERIKREIDDVIFENTRYEVKHSKALSPVIFSFYQEAQEFCEMWKIDLCAIKTYVGREEINFDSN